MHAYPCSSKLGPQIQQNVQIFIWYGSLSGVWWQNILKMTKREKKLTSIFYIWESPHFWSFFHYSRQKCIKNFCSDTLSYCKFCHRIRFWCQLDSGNAQGCLKLRILARKRHKTFRNLSKSINQSSFFPRLPNLTTQNIECHQWDPYQMKIWTICYIWAPSLLEHG